MLQSMGSQRVRHNLATEQQHPACSKPGIWQGFVLFCFYFLAAPLGMQDRSSRASDRTHASCMEGYCLNHWTPSPSKGLNRGGRRLQAKGKKEVYTRQIRFKHMRYSGKSNSSIWLEQKVLVKKCERQGLKI